MQTHLDERTTRSTFESPDDELLVALPEPRLSMSQDTEWCLVRVDGTWREVRFHDYAGIYSVPGLYEKIIYDLLSCNSPRTVRSLLQSELAAAHAPADRLRVLDLGAGNGMMGEELSDLGAEFIVGVDIIEEAAEATERDRPNLYDNYHAVDLTTLDARARREFQAYQFNTLTCVAALGFGDIPPKAFATAYNMIAADGWIAFNIKETFLSEEDSSGFARLMHRMIEAGVMNVRRRQRYVHRRATNGDALHYVAIAAIKRRDIPPGLADEYAPAGAAR